MDPVELLRRMVEIESLSGAEGELAEFLVGAMSSLGFEAFVDEVGNAVGLREGPRTSARRPREIALVGHLDTVPGRIPVRIESGVLHGRGTVDAKGPLATFVQAAARIDPAPDTRIVVVGAVEEECATSRGARYLARRSAPEACLIGEPSGWDGLTLGYKGRMVAECRIEQPGGHGAGPEAPVAERAVTLWDAVRRHVAEHNDDRSGLFATLLATLRSIGTDSDGLTDSVEATIEFRLPPDFDVEVLQGVLLELAGEARITFRGTELAWSSPRTSELARCFTRSIRRHGGRPRFKHKTGTSDLNVLGPVWRCPIAAYGPGDSVLDHRPDERLSIAEYLRAIEVLAMVLAGMRLGSHGLDR